MATVLAVLLLQPRRQNCTRAEHSVANGEVLTCWSVSSSSVLGVISAVIHVASDAMKCNVAFVNNLHGGAKVFRC